ncbi:hypothetical protein C8R48DRAFT_776981 [Suillus tomentosus]|nr:hypothetical protein C8R48DRAFT_776981 [Suillus tomentosus]
MARLLYDDLSTWWSDLKKIVVAITPSIYGLIPPTDLSTQEHANWVEAAAADLLDNSKYLRDGKDELGKTKNFAHPGLHKAEIPLNCFTLIATVFNCVFDGLKKKGMGRLTPIFVEGLPHGLKLVQQLREWVEAGWAEFCKLDSTNTSKHVHLQIELN